MGNTLSCDSFLFVRFKRDPTVLFVRMTRDPTVLFVYIRRDPVHLCFYASCFIDRNRTEFWLLVFVCSDKAGPTGTPLYASCFIDGKHTELLLVFVCSHKGDPPVHLCMPCVLLNGAVVTWFCLFG